MTEIQADLVPFFQWAAHHYKQQQEFIRSDSWQKWFIAGNGTGKSHIVHWDLLAYMLGLHPHQQEKWYPDPKTRMPGPPIKIRVIVPDFDKVEEVSLDKLLRHQLIVYREGNKTKAKEVGPMLPESLIVPKRGYSKDHRGIDLTNGSSISWVTSEQGWKAMRGAQFDILVVDEEPDYRVFDECLRGLRNAKGGGKVIAGLTPPYEEGCGPTWTKDKIVDKADNDPDLDVIQACMADNPAITPEFVKRFSKGKTKEQIQVQVYGNYPSWGDLVHPDFENQDWDARLVKGHILNNDTPLPRNNEVDFVMAFDWHPSKACAAVFGFRDSDGNITFFDELDSKVSKDKTIDELADIFRSIEGHPREQRRFRRWQDPSAKSSYQAVQRGFNAWDAFRHNGIVTSAGKNRDPNVGISIVNEYFRGNGKDHPRIFIYERCKCLIRALGNHYWKRGEDGKGRPDGGWSDYPICVRYILQELGWRERASYRHKSKWPLQSFRKIKPDKQIIDVSRWV